MGRKTAHQIADMALRERRIPRSRLQYGAICWRRKKNKGIRILLVTSRRTRRWVSPKGWPIHGLGPAETAAREAWEEAGVKGRVSPKTLGFYSYRKYIGRDRWNTCVVQVFALEVDKSAGRFPEADERRTKWMKPKKAARVVQEPELANLIRRLAEDLGKS